MSDAISDLITETRHHARRLSDEGDRLSARKLSTLADAAEVQWAREENERNNRREAQVLREAEEFYGGKP